MLWGSRYIFYLAFYRLKWSSRKHRKHSIIIGKKRRRVSIVKIRVKWRLSRRVQKGPKRDPKKVRKCQNLKILLKRAQKGPEGVHKGYRFCHFGSLFIVKVTPLVKAVTKGSKWSKMGPNGSKKGPKGSEKGPKKTPFLTFLGPFYSKNLSHEVVCVAVVA